ncbi:hypothetical protein ABPG75_011044 [Micractinium tetrahymenae]
MAGPNGGEGYQALPSAEYGDSSAALLTSLYAIALAALANAILSYALIFVLEQPGPVGAAQGVATLYLIVALLIMMMAAALIQDFNGRLRLSLVQPGKQQQQQQQQRECRAVAATRVQQDPEGVRREAKRYQEEREAAKRSQTQWRLQGAEVLALQTFEAARMQVPAWKLHRVWRDPKAQELERAWERWRAAADKLAFFEADPDAYLLQHGYEC